MADVVSLSRSLWRLLRTCGLAAALVVSPAIAEAQQYDPRLEFETIATPHFLIHFHQGGREQAVRLAEIAEHVHTMLLARQARAKIGRTHVILSGQDDVPNGWATPLPFNVIQLRTVWPRPSSAIGNTDDWLRLVFTHEYMHILHLDRSRGLMAAARRVFGRVPFALPNLFLPIWQIEGLATWEESQSTGHGRVHDGTARRTLDTAARAGVFEPLDRVSGGLVSWPGGAGPYFYGALFHEYLANRFGAAALDQLAVDSAAWPPFFGTLAFEDALGVPLGDLWKDFSAQYIARARAHAAVDDEALQITHDGFEPGAPRWASDRPGSLYYLRLTPHGFPSIVRVDTATGRSESIASRFRGDGMGTARGKLVFDQLDLTQNVALQSDLYLADTPSSEHAVVTKLTHGARAGDPDLDATGQRIVCVVTGADRRWLATMTVDGTHELTPLVSQPGVYFSSPRWSPDGRRIVAERLRPGTVSEIVIVDAASGEVTPVAPGLGARQATPTWTPDARSIVMAVADEDAPFNLVAVDLDDGRVWQITLRVDGARSPDVSPDSASIAFLGYTALGEDVFVAPFDRARWTEREVTADAGRATSSAPAPSTAATSAVPLDVRKYSPLHGFLPRYWTPLVEYDDESFAAGVSTSSNDALGRHAWQTSLLGRRATRQLEGSLHYTYNRWRPAIFGHLSVETDTLAEGIEETRLLEVGTVIPFARIRHTQQILASVRLESARFMPDDGEVFSIGRHAVRLGWARSTVRAFGYSISPEEGGLVAVSSEHVLADRGTHTGAQAAVGQARYYRRVGLPHAVAAFRIAGASSEGDARIARRFSVGGNGPASSVFDIGREAIALVRGLPEASATGTRAVVVNADYRMPLWRIERGVGAYPAFVQWLHAAVFADAGDAWNPGDRPRWNVAVGAELSADLVVGYSWPFTLAGGVAWVDGPANDRKGRPRAFVRAGRSF